MTVTTFELEFEGPIGADVLAAFEGAHMTVAEDCLTVCVRIRDAEALQGLLAAGQQRGLRVVTVRPLSG